MAAKKSKSSGRHVTASGDPGVTITPARKAAPKKKAKKKS